MSVDDYIAEIDAAYEADDEERMDDVVSRLRAADPLKAYRVLAEAMGLGRVTTELDMRKVHWVHARHVATMLELVEELWPHIRAQGQ